MNITFTTQEMPTSILWLKNHIGLGLTDGYWGVDLIDKGDIMPITTDLPHIMNRISMMRLQGKALSALKTIFLDSFLRHMQQQEWTRRVRYSGI